MIDFSQVTEWTIPQGDVLRVSDTNNTRVIWEKNIGPTPQYDVPFWIECDNSVELVLKKYTGGSTVSQNNVTVYYSTDNISWNSWGTTSTTTPLSLQLTANTKYYFKSTNDSFSKMSSDSSYGFHRFEPRIYTSSRVWKVGGNVLSLIYGDDYQNYSTLKNIQYTSLCHLIRLDNINARNLAIPLTCTQNYEYYEMLPDCSFAPLLPSTVLTDYCYSRMFIYSTFDKAPELSVTTLASHCYYQMFGSSTFTKAPDLPATTLVNSCYREMFSGCNNLNTINCFATNGINANNSTTSWTNNVSATGTFTKAAGVTWPSGSSGIPSDWTVIEQ